MKPWVKRSIISTTIASTAALGGYLIVRSAKERPAPTLEDLVAIADLKLSHPGGQTTTKRLVEACEISPDTEVLDVASGAGDSACLLAQSYGAMVTGIDTSEEMIEVARGKAIASGIETRVSFLQADPHELPFKKESFDAVIAEFATSALDKELAVGEWARVLRRGGCVGIHDVVWLREPMLEERERTWGELGMEPETVTDWIEVFRKAGLASITTVDVTKSWSDYASSILGEMGVGGTIRTAAQLTRRFGANAAKIIPILLRIQLMTRLSVLGYAIIVGRKY